MKKIGILLMMLVMASFAGMSQNSGGGGQQRSPEERAKSETATIKEKCGLDDAQEKKVYDILLANGKKGAELQKEIKAAGGPDDASKDKMKKLRDEVNTEMKKVLSADQYTKYEKYLEERRAQRQGGGGPR